MQRRLLRAIVAIATFAVVWLVVSPASARESAPMCDPRGAITFAPPPQIQDEERSLDIPADCFEVSPLEIRNVVPGRGGSIELSFSQEPVAAGRPALLSFSFEERVPFVKTTSARPRSGARTSVERPPRFLLSPPARGQRGCAP